MMVGHSVWSCERRVPLADGYAGQELVGSVPSASGKMNVFHNQKRATIWWTGTGTGRYWYLL